MIFKHLEHRCAAFGDMSKKPCSHSRRRSNMMVNPLVLEHINSIDESEADMITLNLEDAIAPSRKREALDNIGLFLSHMEHSNSFIIVRVNPLDEGGAKEIEYLNDFSFDAVRVAKIKTQSEVARALTLLSDEKELHISLETKEAFENLGSLRIDERLTTANLGILDLLNSLGLPQSIARIANPTMDYILSKFLIDSKTAGIHPISFMYQQYNDTERFRAWCMRENMMGFESKACMGPKQVAIANEIFNIGKDEVAKAKYIKNMFEANEANGINGFMDDKYGFIDEPIYKDALLTLAKELKSMIAIRDRIVV